MGHDIEDINVVPLVDIMLVLLVIVLTTASFVSMGQIPVNLASAKNAEASQEESIKLVVQADGNVIFNQHALATAELAEAMRDISRQSTIVLYADRSVMLERFVAVADVIKTQGFEKLSLQVERQ